MKRVRFCKNKNAVVNLSLNTIKFPITAIFSILHRISGVLAFLILGYVMYIMKYSLTSNEHFIEVKHIVYNTFGKCTLLIVLLIIMFHMLYGIRHILLDFGIIKNTLKANIFIIKIISIIIVCLSITFWYKIW